MRSFLFVSMIAVLPACGDDGGSSVDAMPMIDAAPDGPGATQGLGQLCGTGMPACPSTAPDCLTTANATVGFCSAECVTNGTGTTNAQGQLVPAMITPAPNQAACTSAFSASVGTPVCALILGGYQPPDNPMMASKQYTMITLECAIACGTGNTCPTGLTCNQGGCFPP